jgi:hypothetical protein
VKKALKILLCVYAVICIFIVTVLLVSFIIVWVNFDKIVSFSVEKAEDAFNVELKTILNNSFPEKITPVSLINFINNGGLSGIISEQLNSEYKTAIESIVTMKRPNNNNGSTVSLLVKVNGEPAAVLDNGRELNFPVKNGKHIISITNITSGLVSEIVFEANYSGITFNVGFNAAGMYIEKAGEVPLN